MPLSSKLSHYTLFMNLHYVRWLWSFEIFILWQYRTKYSRTIHFGYANSFSVVFLAHFHNLSLSLIFIFFWVFVCMCGIFVAFLIDMSRSIKWFALMAHRHIYRLYGTQHCLKNEVEKQHRTHQQDFPDTNWSGAVIHSLTKKKIFNLIPCTCRSQHVKCDYFFITFKTHIHRQKKTASKQTNRRINDLSWL